MIRQGTGGTAMTQMTEKTKLTIKEAAEFLGYSNKSTLMKHKKEGRFSTETDENNVLLVDKSELRRVYPTRYEQGQKQLIRENQSIGSESSGLTQEQPVNDPNWSLEKTNDPNVLRYLLQERDQQLEELKEALQQKDQRIDDLIEKITQLALPGPEKVKPEKKTLWQRIFGTPRNDEVENQSQSTQTVKS